MYKLLNSEILKLLARIMVAIVFLFFGVEKIAAPAKFAKEILNYGFFPLFSVNLIAIILPWIEVIVGFALLFGIRIKSSAFLSGMLMLGFIVAVGIAIAMGLDISCGCSASHDLKVGWQKIIENFAYLILSTYLFFFSSTKIGIDRIN